MRILGVLALVLAVGNASACEYGQCAVQVQQAFLPPVQYQRSFRVEQQFSFQQQYGVDLAAACAAAQYRADLAAAQAARAAADYRAAQAARAAAHFHPVPAAAPPVYVPSGSFSQTTIERRGLLGFSVFRSGSRFR